MERSTLAAVVVLASLAAGVAPAPVRATDAAPAATSTPADPAFHSARKACIDRAVRETETVTPQGQASKAAIGIYVECMKEKGFPVHAR